RLAPRQSFVASFVREYDAPARDNGRARARDTQLPVGAGSPARTQATESLTGRWPHRRPTRASTVARNFQLLPQLPRLCRSFHPSVVTLRELSDNLLLATRSG